MTLGMAHTVPGLGDSITGQSATAAASQAKAAKIQSAGASIAAGAVAGAAAGATAGSVVPLLGTAIGAVVGAIIGTIPGIIAMTGALQGGTTHAERMQWFGATVQGQVNDLPDVFKLVQDSTKELQRFQTLSQQAIGTTPATGMSGLTAVVASSIKCGQGTSCHSSMDLQQKIKDVTDVASGLQQAIAHAISLGGTSPRAAQIVASAQDDLKFGQDALAVAVPAPFPSNYPTSDAAWQNLDAFETAAKADISLLSGLGMSVQDALDGAVGPNQALSKYIQDLLNDANLLAQYAQTINPWSPTPASDAAKRIPGEAATVQAALQAATNANDVLESALAWRTS